MNILIVALRATAGTLLLTGLAYPLAMTGPAQLLFPHKANGSLVTDETGKVVGSRLISRSPCKAGRRRIIVGRTWAKTHE